MDSPLADRRVRLARGDLTDPESVRKAAAGCSAVFILTPHSPNQVELQNNAVDAAADAGAKVVKVSSWGPSVHAESPVPGARRHWITQQYVIKRQVPYTFLQPNYFMQVLTNRYAGEVRRRGVLVSPAGDRGISMVDTRDIAEVAARTMIESGHDGLTYVLSGPASVTYHQVARKLSERLGREITYHAMNDEEFAEWMVQENRQQWETDHAAAIFGLYRQGIGEMVTDDVQRVTGRPPRTIDSFLDEHLHLFRPVNG